MTTANTIIYDALKELNVLAEGDTPTASMANDALRALNRLVQKFSNDQAFAWYPNQINEPLTGTIDPVTGHQSFTIGPTGDVVTQRPIKIESAVVDRQGITYPVQVIDFLKWDSIVYKAVTGANTVSVWYEAQEPNGIVHCWPVASGCTLRLRVINVVASFPDLVTDVTLPPGYEEALMKNLAVHIAPQYPAGVLQPLTQQQAKAALKYVNRTNNVIPTMAIDNNILTKRGGSLAGFLGGY